MPDSEIFKLILNSGLFGLWAIFLVWLLFYGAPLLKQTMRDLADAHRAVSKAQADAAVQAAVQATESIKAISKECREERLELMERFDEERRQQSVMYRESLQSVLHNK